MLTVKLHFIDLWFNLYLIISLQISQTFKLQYLGEGTVAPTVQGLLVPGGPVKVGFTDRWCRRAPVKVSLFDETACSCWWHKTDVRRFGIIEHLQQRFYILMRLDIYVDIWNKNWVLIQNHNGVSSDFKATVGRIYTKFKKVLFLFLFIVVLELMKSKLFIQKCFCFKCTNSF